MALPRRAVRLPVLVSLLCVTACAAGMLRPPTVEPLGDDGELYVYLQPLPGDARRLSFALASVAARGADGDVPLQLLNANVSGGGVQHQRLLASGRLAPGRYGGLLVQISEASVRTPEGATKLLVGPEIGRVDVPFTIERRRATVVSVSVGEQRPGDSDYAFVRALSAGVAVAPPPQLAGYCSVPGKDAVAVFDKRAHEVRAVLPGGAGPLGLSLDGIRGRIYAAFQRDDRVDVIDATSRDVIAGVSLRPGDAPREVALLGGGAFLFVLNEGSSSVSVIDAGATTEVGRIPVDEQPWSLVVDRPRTRAYVLSRRENSITALDLATRASVARATTEPEPLWGAIDRAGTRLYVVHRGSVYMAVYTLPRLTLERQVFVGAPASFVKVDPRTDLVYVALADEPRVQVFDPLSLVPLSAVEVASPIAYMAIDDVDNTMFMAMPRLRTIGVLDLTSRKQVGAFEVNAEPHAVILAGERH